MASPSHCLKPEVTSHLNNQGFPLKVSMNQKPNCNPKNSG